MAEPQTRAIARSKYIGNNTAVSSSRSSSRGATTAAVRDRRSKSIRVQSTLTSAAVSDGTTDRNNSSNATEVPTTVPTRRRRACRVVVDVTACRYAVVRKCLRERGYRLVKARAGEAAKPQWDIWWSDRGDLLKDLPRLNAFQKINHFPAMEEICRKDFLANNLNAIAKVLPDVFDFFPRSFLLPAERVELQTCMERTSKGGATFIAKPRTLCQGKGIALVQRFTQVPNEPCVVQRYIDTPLLVDGFKFDLRVYVLVLSVDPLHLFVFRNGLARFCTSAFEKPTKRNLSHKRMHLTNYAVNKHSKHFEHATSEHSGSKRSLASVLQLLEVTHQIDSRTVWTQICAIVVKTLLSVAPKLQATYRSFFGARSGDAYGSQCFEVLGFDILLDARGKAWLLEANHAPSFAGDSALDREIKHALIAATLAHVGVTNDSKRAFVRGRQREWAKRLWQPQRVAVHSTRRAATAASASMSQQDVRGSADALQSQQQQQVGDDAAIARSGGNGNGDDGGGGGVLEEKVASAAVPDDEPAQNSSDDDDVDHDDNDGVAIDSSGTSSDSEQCSDNQDDAGAESLGSRKQRTRTTAKGPSSSSSSSASATGKLSSIRRILQKTNRVLPCSNAADESTASTAPSVHDEAPVESVDMTTVTVSEQQHAAVAFTNEFVQVYPVDASVCPELSDAEAKQLRELYERISVAAEVNKSKLWS